jgi:signal transduction histidine kinase
MQLRVGQPWHSIERKLPLLIGAVVALVLLTALGVAHYEVRQSALKATDERLQRLAGQIGTWVDNALTQRERTALEVAADPAVVALLRGDTAALADAAEALDRLRTRADSGSIIQLRNAMGGLVATTHSATMAWLDSSDPVDPRIAPVDETRMRFSAPFITAQGGVYWASVPVRSDETTLGHVQQLRRVSNPGVAAQFEALIGERLDIYFAAPGGPWVGLDGSSIKSPDALPVGQPVAYERSDGAQHYALARPIPGHEWLMVVDVPLASALAGTRVVTRRVLGFGLVLLPLGGLLAWLVSRSVTAPLRRLGLAADAIATGDYSRRTGIERTDEIGHLARSFDAMADHVEGTHREIEQRFIVARTLAAELRATNAALQRAVDEIDAARDEAQQASRAKSEFLATMSHEIRTPINAVVGYTDLMEMGLAGPLTVQQREYIGRIRMSSEHLTTLVNDVLDFAKIESGQMRFAREVGSVPAVINAVASMLQGRSVSKQVELRIDCPLETVFLGDGHRVQQILLNLVANALKFTDEGGRVDISCERRASRAHPPMEDAADQHEWTCITVADNGIGIAADQLDRIFEPFVQGQPGYTRPHGGAGLGLAISRSLARLMGGDISVESAPGDGARFTVWLPHPASASALVSAQGRNPDGDER